MLTHEVFADLALFCASVALYAPLVIKKSGYKSQSDMLFSWESFKNRQSWDWIMGVILEWLYLSKDLNNTENSFKNSLAQHVPDVCRL